MRFCRASLTKAVMMRLHALGLALALSACSSPPPCPPPETGDMVYVVEHGWHAEIGIPVSQLTDDMVFLKKIFPGARVLMFGYGKKTFFTASPRALSEYVIGPFPGTAVIHVVGLNATPPEAYMPGDVVTLPLPKGGRAALSAFIWEDLAKDDSDKPRIVSRSHNPEGLFYAADSEYNLLHTCNTWTADALHAAGLPVSGNWVTFSGGVMKQVYKADEGRCRPTRP